MAHVRVPIYSPSPSAVLTAHCLCLWKFNTQNCDDNVELPTKRKKNNFFFSSKRKKKEFVARISRCGRMDWCDCVCGVYSKTNIWLISYSSCARNIPNFNWYNGTKYAEYSFGWQSAITTCRPRHECMQYDCGALSVCAKIVFFLSVVFCARGLLFYEYFDGISIKRLCT